VTRRAKLTVDDLVALWERPEYEFDRLEIIDGALVVSSTPPTIHQLVSANLMMLVGPRVIEPRLGLMLGLVGVRLSAHDVVQPDQMFIRRDRRHIIGPTMIDGAPDLVIEILSKATRRRDLTTKKAL
jgi:Uma2 family endonuclease